MRCSVNIDVSSDNYAEFSVVALLGERELLDELLAAVPKLKAWRSCDQKKIERRIRRLGANFPASDVEAAKAMITAEFGLDWSEFTCNQVEAGFELVRWLIANQERGVCAMVEGTVD